MSRVLAAANRPARRRSPVYPALISLGFGVLASCAEKPPPPPPQTVAIEPPPAPPPPALPRRRVFPLPAHKPTPPPENLPGLAQSDTQAMAFATTPPRIPHPPSANQLIGLDQPGATRLFGAATEQTEAPPATVWHYRSPTCELELFFYLDLRSGKMRTLHYTFKDNPGGSEDCLRSLVAARRT